MAKILLIDDDQETYVLVSKALGNSLPLTWARSLSEGWTLSHKEPIELILLDVMLPDGDGFQFCAKLQNEEVTQAIPIILLTGKKGVAHRVLGFSLGADDYLEKPFDLQELRARVESKLKKKRQNKSAEELIHIGNLEINLGTQRVCINLDGHFTEIFLTPIEFRLMQHLAKNCERAFSRDQLITAAWGENISVADRTVDKHISALRQKLQSCGEYIQTVPGYGYRLVHSENRHKTAA